MIQKGKNMMQKSVFKTVLAACLFTVGVAGPAQAKDVVIHAGVLIDGVSETPRRQVSIIVRDDKIVSVESGFQNVAGAEVIDLSSATLLPGFIDTHIHVASKLPSKVNRLEYAMTHSGIDIALQGAVFARQMLQQGITAARDLSGGDYIVALRDAIDGGMLAGPRLHVALEAIGPTAGHGDKRTGLDPALSNATWDNGIVDSPEEARFRVREHHSRGATVIKIMPSGGMSSTGDNPNMQLMTNEEMRAAVETAHAIGMKVAAHAYPPGAIENAVRAGVDSIEHGSFATEQTFALMKEHGTYLVPTLTVFDVYYEVARDNPELLRPGTAEKELELGLLPKKNFPLAVKSGVKIAYGTDIGEGDHRVEFQLLVDNGMTPLQAIFAATRDAADLLGVSDQIGSIQAGRFADIIAVEGDPLTNPEVIQNTLFVMKGGVVFRAGGAPTTALTD